MVYSDYSLANAIILFGAFQGLLLITFLLKKKQGNPIAYWFFTLFLFSLAYVNLWYGLYFMGIYSFGQFPMVAIPYPYEFFLGIGFYFYIKSIKKTKPPSFKKEFYLFIPAILYVLLELYWYFFRYKRGEPNIYRRLEETGFYTVIEYLRFIFNLILCLLAIQFLNKIKRQTKLSIKEAKKIQWLFTFSYVFLGYNLLSLLLTSLAFILFFYSLQSFYLTFFTNTIFIYWIGYIGYTKPNTLFSMLGPSAKIQNNKKQRLIEEKLTQIMEVEEQFIHSDFSLSKLAMLSKISSKELSDYINTVYKCNVPEYINKYRVEKVKTLLDSLDYQHYTLEAIAREAGFKSKSSFNSIFKKHTAISPSQYKKRKK